jgi:hypothetical protein
MTKKSVRAAGIASAIVVGCVGLAAPPAAGSVGVPGWSVAGIAHKSPVKLAAKPDKSKVKVGEHTKIRGRLTLSPAGGGAAAATPADGVDVLFVQQLVAGVWVDLASGPCAPDDDFSIDVSFTVAATLSLRVYAPETDVYAAASSDVFALVVI